MLVRALQNRGSSSSVFSSRSSWGPKVTEDWSNWLRSKHESPKWVELPEVEKSKDEECFEIDEKDQICLEFNQDIHNFSTEINQEISSMLSSPSPTKSDFIPAKMPVLMLPKTSQKVKVHH